MLDKILVFISLIALIVFCGVVVTFVAEPDLIITVSLILALASHDFWISVFKKAQPSRLDTSGTLESLPTGVSGKPIKPAVAKAAPKPKRKPAAKTAAKRKAPARKAAPKRKTAAKRKK